MAKKGLILLLMLTTIMTLTSCGLDYRYSLDESLHNQIEYESDEVNYYNIIYQGERYIWAGTSNSFNVITHSVDNTTYVKYQDDILLSWNGYRYIWYIDEYYSYTTDCPLYIYNERTHDVFFIRTIII